MALSELLDCYLGSVHNSVVYQLYIVDLPRLWPKAKNGSLAGRCSGGTCPPGVVPSRTCNCPWCLPPLTPAFRVPAVCAVSVVPAAACRPVRWNRISGCLGSSQLPTASLASSSSSADELHTQPFLRRGIEIRLFQTCLLASRDPRSQAPLNVHPAQHPLLFIMELMR